MFYVKQQQLAVIVGVAPPIILILHIYSSIIFISLHSSLTEEKSPPSPLTSSVLVAQVREPPDIGEVDSEANHGQEEVDLLPPGLPVLLAVWVGLRRRRSHQGAGRELDPILLFHQDQLHLRESERSRRSMNTRLSCTHSDCTTYTVTNALLFSYYTYVVSMRIFFCSV